jgi:hypothetical protein
MFRKLIGAAAVLVLASAGSAQVMLNEIYYDNPGGENPDVLFTELYGLPGTNLAGWTLIGINGNDGAEYRTVTLQGSVPPDGYYVVGNTASVLNVDYVCGGGTNAGVDWQNAGYHEDVDCDGVDLRDPDGGVVDHVCYGTCATPGNCTGEGGTNAPDYDPLPAGPAKSLSRIPDHTDTDDNAHDWQMTDVLTPGALNQGGTPCDSQYVTLSQIRQNDANGVSLLDSSFVITRGIVNVDNYVLDSLTLSNFYFQDDDAGVNVYRGVAPAGIVAGDCVVVAGWVGQYRGLTELLSGGQGNCLYRVQVVGHVNPPSPTYITGSSPFEVFEGMLVRMNHVTIVDGTWPAEGQWANLTVTDGNGFIILRINRWTNVDGSPQPVQPFDLIGILLQYDASSPYTEGYEITPRSTADIIPGDAVDPNAPVMSSDFRLLGVYPNPFNSVTEIRFMVGSVRDVTLDIFDILGRPVAGERLARVTPGEHTYAWSPQGPTGLYLLRLSDGPKSEVSKLLYLK